MRRIKKLEERVEELEDKIWLLRNGSKHGEARWRHFVRTGVARMDAAGWCSLGPDSLFDDTPIATVTVTIPYTGQDKEELERVWESYGIQGVEVKDGE